MKNKIFTILSWIILVVSILLLYSSFWVKGTFGLLNFDSLLYHLNTNLSGTSSDMIFSFIYNPLLKTIITIIIIVIIVNHKYDYKPYLVFKIFKFKEKKVDLFHLIKKIRLMLSIFLFIVVIIFIIFYFNVLEYYKNTITYSTFIEENYVNPENTNIKFNKKKNLVHIYVESFENTFFSKEYGGAYDDNLLPNLTGYLNNEIMFLNPNGGGFYNSRATGWTIAAMVAQTAGVGLIVPVNGNEYGINSSFLPGVYAMGDILNKEGYNQTLLIGSDANFAGRKSYFQQHGNYQIKDYLYAKENNLIPKDYYVWWGYEDSKLFSFAKDELLDLSSKNEPFNLTLLTTNTHHIGGYLEEDCEVRYNEQLKNAILCTDLQLYEFVEWIKQQDFYNNTTIVITGDHLSMEPSFFNDLGTYERTNFNMFINANYKTVKNTNRLFSTLDLFPTILSSIGAEFDGNKLGLGTNLFSNEKTLYEIYGRDYVESELSKSSRFYQYEILEKKK